MFGKFLFFSFFNFLVFNGPFFYFFLSFFFAGTKGRDDNTVVIVLIEIYILSRFRRSIVSDLTIFLSEIFDADFLFLFEEVNIELNVIKTKAFVANIDEFEVAAESIGDFLKFGWSMKWNSAWVGNEKDVFDSFFIFFAKFAEDLFHASC